MTTTASKPAKPTRQRHKWVKLRLHVYICKLCGMGRENLEPSDTADWRTIYHFPTGISRVETHVPECKEGPQTLRALAKYATQIAEWKGNRDAIGKADTPKAEGDKF